MHRQIYRAIRNRNPEAAREAMRQHLVLAQRAQELELQTSNDPGNGHASTSDAKPM